MEESGGQCCNFDGSFADVSCRDLVATSWEGIDNVHVLNKSIRNVLERMNVSYTNSPSSSYSKSCEGRGGEINIGKPVAPVLLAQCNYFLH